MRPEELIDQEPVRAVDLDPVEAQRHRIPRRLGESGHHRFDIGQRHWLAFDPFGPRVGAQRCGGHPHRRRADARPRRSNRGQSLQSGMGELRHDTAARCMDGLHRAAPSASAAP